MRDGELYRKILGIEALWRVNGIKPALGEASGSVTVTVEAEPGTRLPCPECGRPCQSHDSRCKE